MQTKGKKKIIDNAGALQKKYAWKSEKMQDTKKAPQGKCRWTGGCRRWVEVWKQSDGKLIWHSHNNNRIFVAWLSASS